MTEKTGKEAGLSGDEQILFSLQAIVNNGGKASMPTLYEAVEKNMNGVRLSKQGQASLRNFINSKAVKHNFVISAGNGFWQITPKGIEFVENFTSSDSEQEKISEVENKETDITISNSARGAAFENYVLKILKKLYPKYAWYNQGSHKNNERGLDFIGSLLEFQTEINSIGVQVKFHAENTSPSKEEWLKFLAGCFTRRIDQAIFITTGRLRSEQRREAGESKVIIIEGREEVKRIANEYGVEEFDWFEDKIE